MTKYTVEPVYAEVERIIAQSKSSGGINSLVDEEYKHRAMWRHRKWFAQNFGPDDVHRADRIPFIPSRPIATTKV